MFKDWYGFVTFIGNDTIPVGKLKRTHNGFYKDDICNYIKYGIIEKVGTNSDNEDIYKLTSLGKKLFRQEIKIDTVLSLYKK